MDITNNDKRFLSLAHKVAKRSTHRDHQLGAVVVRGGSVINLACNHQRWGRHAEARALRPHMDMTDATLYVVRDNKRCSKPCEKCREMIREAGIKTIIYYNENNVPFREHIEY